MPELNDPFAAVPFETGPLPQEEDPFADVPLETPLEPSEPPVPLALPEPLESGGFISSAQAEEGVDEDPFAAVPLAEGPPEGSNAVMRGLNSALFEGNPRNIASTLKGFADLTDSEALRTAAVRVEELAQKPDALDRPRAKDLFDIYNDPSVSDALTLAGELFGQGVGSIAVPAVAAGAGAVVAGGPGAVGGGILGSAALNFGEVRQALVDEGVDPKMAAKIMLVAGPAMVALDAIPIGSIVARLGGLGEFKKQTMKVAARELIERGFITRVGQEGGKIALLEGATEATQEIIKEAAVSLAADKPFFTGDNLEGILTSGLAGMLVGGAVGGLTGTVPDRPFTIAGEDTLEDTLGEAPRVERALPAEGPLEGPQPDISVEERVGELLAEEGINGAAVVANEREMQQIAAEQQELAQGAIPIEPLASGVEPVAVPVRGFFSQVLKVINEKIPGRATPEQILRTLEKAPGVKKEELETMGIPHWLSMRDGKVLKKDLVAFAEGSQVHLREVIRGGVDVTNPVTFIEGPFDEAAFTMGRAHDTLGNRYEIVSALPARVGRSAIRVHVNGRERTFGPFSALTTAERAIRTYALGKAAETQGSAAPKFLSWTLPGGQQGYTEIVLTYPQFQQEGKFIPSTQILDRMGKVRDKIRATKPELADIVFGLSPEGLLNNRERIRDIFNNLELARIVEPRDRYTFESFMLELREVKKLEGATFHHVGHFSEENILAHFRMTSRIDREGKSVLLIEEIQSDLMQRGRRRGFLKTPQELRDEGRQRLRDQGFGEEEIDNRPVIGFAHQRAGALPSFPFKTTWDELAIKRIFSYAVEKGFDRVAIVPYEVQLGRNLGTDTNALVQRYKIRFPSIMTRWARKLGTTTGMTRIDFPDTDGVSSSRIARDERGNILIPSDLGFFFVDVTPQMEDNVRKGMPLLSQPTGYTVDAGAVRRNPEEGKSLDGTNLLPALFKFSDATAALAARMGVNVPIAITVREKASRRGPRLGQVQPFVDTEGNYTGFRIDIWLSEHKNEVGFYATLMHELGHVIKFTLYQKAPTQVVLAVREAHQKFLRQTRDTVSMNRVIQLRDNFISRGFNMRGTTDRALQSFHPETRQMWLSEDEFFAEQVAKWATTSDVPLNFVDRFFKGVADRIKSMYRHFKAQGFNIPADPEQLLGEWLDTLVTEGHVHTFHTAKSAMDLSRDMNQNVMNDSGFPEYPATPETLESGMLRKAMASMKVPPSPTVVAMDRLILGYKYMLGIVQLADLNPQINGLQRYRELFQLMNLERMRIMDEAQTTVKAWNRLRRQDSDNLSAFLDAYMNMDYLTKAEIAAGTTRMPTAAERAALAKKFKLSAEAITVFQRIEGDFSNMLRRYRDMLLEEARDGYNRELATAAGNTLSAAQALGNYNKRVKEINAQIGRYQRQPYFPAMRFGNFTITVRDSAGKQVHFETTESRRKRRAIAKLAQVQFPASQGFKVVESVLAEDASPMTGLPGALLQKIGQRLELSKTQKANLEQLMFELAPAQSFKHRFQRKNRVPGYSKDFKRAYANYFFHGSNYLAKIKYFTRIQDTVGEVTKSAKGLDLPERRILIANFMSEHLHYFMNPKADFATIRAATAMWALAFSPAAAGINLTQNLISSAPFLSSKFGDKQGLKALTKAGTKLGTYYRRATLSGTTDADLRMLHEAIKEGIITEALATEVAAMSETDNLSPGIKARAGRNLQFVLQKGMILFELSEQTNRRIIFRAAVDLARNNPNNAYVQESIKKHRLQYNRLIAGSASQQAFTPGEAAAFVTGKDAVESTQFIYQHYAQPKIFRGKARTIFIFKTFLQNMMFNAMGGRGKGTAVRTLLTLGFLGGLMGLPGADDLRGLLKGIAFRFGGHDLDIEREAREFLVENLDFSPRVADIVLLGSAREGYGIPAMMDLLGVPFPTFDRSKAVSLGQISPFDFGIALGPESNQSQAIAESVQKGSGAAFGVGFNLYKALTDGQLAWNDLKRWQKAMPRSIASITKSYQALSGQGVQTRDGTPIVKFDLTDSKQLMEALGLAAGYQNVRTARTWDRLIAQREVSEFWNITRGALLRQIDFARRGGDKEEITRVLARIRQFNFDLPPEARLKAITADTIVQSLMAKRRDRALKERGFPSNKSDIGISRKIGTLFPDPNITIEKVK